MGDGDSVVARLSIEGAEFWLSDESPEHHNHSPESLGGITVRIILTVSDPDALFAGAIKAGAKGYLLKDARREELLDCIRRVNAGETCLPPALAAKLVDSLSSEPLTGRELDVLALLARGKSNKEIGVNLYISETTVKAHLRSIFGKLNVLSRTEAIAAASRRGLVQL